jgi:hypothetical protein
VVSLGLPVLDTAIAIIRRFLRRQPIFSADRGHIHHRLLGRGHSPRTVVLVLYGVCALLALGAMLLVNDGGHVALVLLTIGVGVGFLIQRLRIYEFEEAARLLRRSVHPRRTIERGARVREASARLSKMVDLTTVFASLADVFAADGCPRAEVRLAMAFLDGRDGGLRAGSDHVRHDDDVAVWTWCAATPDTIDEEWWQIILPLTGDRGLAMGSLVLWKTLESIDAPFSHFHVIAGELRTQIQAKLWALWPGGAGVSQASPALPEGIDGIGTDRTRRRRRVSSGPVPAVPAL